MHCNANKKTHYNINLHNNWQKFLRNSIRTILSFNYATYTFYPAALHNCENCCTTDDEQGLWIQWNIKWIPFPFPKPSPLPSLVTTDCNKSWPSPNWQTLRSFWMRWNGPLKSYYYWTCWLFYIDIAILPLETRPYIFQLRAKILKILGLRIGPISDALLREAAKWHCQCQNTANVHRCSVIMFANVRPHRSKAHLFSIN